jgi:class 3 adenylate cyclase/tetratricopeptide (TPR) repeat protein
LTTHTLTQPGLEPYVPRLVRTWDGLRGGVDAIEVDGTLVSVDLSGFTALSERLAAKGRAGAEELILLISGVYEGLIGIAERRGGDVLKFRGDALLIFFEDDDHAVRACVAAGEMQWLIETTGRTRSSVGQVELAMAVGIVSGPCHFFLTGLSHRELVIAGPAASDTLRLEDAAEAHEILVSAATARALEPGWLAGERDGAMLLRRGLHDEAPAESTRFDALPSDVDLEEFVPIPLRRVLAAGAAEAEHRQATVAFVKFTDAGEVLAREGLDGLDERLQRLGEVVDRTVDGLGITWLESDIDVDGGKVYLTAGAPATPGGDEERMLLALRAIVDEGCGLTLRAGVNRGHVFAGEIGADSRRTYAVMGDTVNLAARLAGRARPGQILATGDVLERARTRFESSSQPFLMKGKERAVTAYSVGALLGVREEQPPERLPLVGREREVAALKEAVDAARMRQSRLIELVGEPGIGKTRLIDELTALSLGFTQLVARSEAYATAAPYFVFRPLLRQLAGILPTADRGEAGAQLSAWVQGVMPDQAPWLPLLGVVFDAEVPATPETDALGASVRRQRLHEAVEQFLVRVLMMPTLLVFEDTHWLDDASRELLLHLALRPTPRPWLVCVTRRPRGASFIDDGGAEGLVLALEPLAPDLTASLARVVDDELSLSEEALESLVARAGGNPLFVRELVAAIRRGAAGELPETVERLMTERIDTLDPEDRLLLRVAAVAGARFDLDLMRELLGDELGDVGEIERWQRVGEFVEWRGDDTLRFRHDLFRSAAYEGLSFRRRRDVHARIGAALERRAGERTEEAAGLLSLHFLEGGELEKAWHYSVVAGRRAQKLWANVDAAEFYERALSAAGDLAALDPVEVSAVAESLGDVCELAARYDEASAAYARARALVGGDVVATARLLRKEGVLHERLGGYDDALQRYRRALELLDSPTGAAAPGSDRVELEVEYATVLFRQGHFEECLRWAERAAEHAQTAGYRPGLAHAYRVLNTAHRELGGTETTWFELALPIYEELGDRVGKAIVLNNLGVSAYFSGRWDEAMTYYEQSVEEEHAAGDPIRAANSSNNVAEILLDQGRLEPAVELLREALRVYNAAGYTFGAGVAKKNLARAAATVGAFDEAHVLFDEALAHLEEIGAGTFVFEAKARRAECYVLEGSHREALALAQDLLAEAKDALVERLLGYALVQARRPEEARPHFDESLRLARERGARYEVARTLRALSETGSQEHAEEAQQLLDSLGVVSLPRVPLP